MLTQKFPANYSKERTQASRLVSGESVSLWRLARAAHAGRWACLVE